MAENEDLLRLVWESFDHEGEWPQAAQLTRRHFASRPRRDYAEIACLMPPQLRRLDPMSAGRIMLSPRGLSYLMPSSASIKQTRRSGKRSTAIAGGHLSEEAATRCAGISRATARRYKLGAGDRVTGRQEETGWPRTRDPQPGDLPTKRWPCEAWPRPNTAPDATDGDREGSS